LTVDSGILVIYSQIFGGRVGHLLLVASPQLQDGCSRMQTSELSIRLVRGGGRTRDGGLSLFFLLRWWTEFVLPIEMVNFMKHWWTKELQ